MIKRLTVWAILLQLVLVQATWADGKNSSSFLSTSLKALLFFTTVLSNPLQAVTSQPQQNASDPFQPCPRLPVGSVITEAEHLFSKDGTLNVSLSYQTRVDDSGNQLFCYTAPNNQQAPTLHVKPGDHLFITLNNQLPSDPSSPQMVMNSPDAADCGASVQDATSVNIHFHGMSIPPTCHKDNVVTTLVNSGQTFTYGFEIPKNAPSGLYAYHDHVHGQSEAALLGGASGAIVVEGIENVEPVVAGLPERILTFRDNVVPGNSTDPNVPAWDVSLNYIPIPYPNYTPVVIPMKPNEKQFWRVANEGADTILDLQLLYDGVPQPLELVALDGVALGSQDGDQIGTTRNVTHISMPLLRRAEFIVRGPSADVKNATLVTLPINTGPDGDNDPYRPLASIQVSPNATEPPLTMPATSGNPPSLPRYHGLENEVPAQNRTLYFSEVLQDPTKPAGPTNFYITVDGQIPTLFNSSNAPAIIAMQGTVEKWRIENRALEDHVFHIHQVHFLLKEKDGVPVSPDEQQYLDTVIIPAWSGNDTDPYPSVDVMLDFRGIDIGSFVYHCHILGHEDNGMMAIIKVVPNPDSPWWNSTQPHPPGGPSVDGDHGHIDPWEIGTYTGIGVSVSLLAYIAYEKTRLKEWMKSDDRFWNRWFFYKSKSASETQSQTPQAPPQDVEMGHRNAGAAGGNGSDSESKTLGPTFWSEPVL